MIMKKSVVIEKYVKYVMFSAHLSQFDILVLLNDIIFRMRVPLNERSMSEEENNEQKCLSSV